MTFVFYMTEHWLLRARLTPDTQPDTLTAGRAWIAWTLMDGIIE